MGFLGNLLSATVKTAITPLAIAKDVLTLGEADATKKHVESIGKDVEDAFNSDSVL